MKISESIRKELLSASVLIVAVILIIVCVILVPAIGHRQQDQQEAESLAFIQSLQGANEHYKGRVKDYYFGLSDESLIGIAADFFPKQLDIPYTVGSEAKMIQFMTDGKYEIKQGWLKLKIMRVTSDN